MSKVPIILLVVGIAAAAGVPTYLSLTGDSGTSTPRTGRDTGTAAKGALGKFESMDSWLTGKGLEKKKRDSIPSAIRSARSSGGPLFSYLEVQKSRDQNTRFDVTVAADAEGQVGGVHAAFLSGSEQAGSSSKAEEFMLRLWKKTAGKKPSFEWEQRGSGVSAEKFLVAKFERNGIQGTWRKKYLRKGKTDSIFDEVSVSIE